MLNKIVTDLETSKKLKELGIEMDHFVSWAKSWHEFLTYDFEMDIQPDITESWPAYTLEQILEMFIYKGTIDIYRGKNGYFGINFNNEISYYRQDGDNMTTTAAKLLIRLVEGKTIKIGE